MSKIETQIKPGEFIYQEMSSPFLLEEKDSQKAALLIHGFLASPYIMRSIAYTLHQHGYTVQVIQLPGHGENPDALRHVSHKAWQTTVNEALIKLKAAYPEVIIVGFSIGAILGLMAAFQEKVNQLILFAPAFKISAFGKIAKWLSYVGLDKWLPDLFCTHSEANNLGSYTRFPAHSVAEVQKVIDAYHHKLKTPSQTLPHIYVASSMDDGTTKFSGLLKALRLYKQGSRYRIYTSNPSYLPEYIGTNDIRVIDVNQFKRIQAFSHVAIPVAPSDPYFGKKGAYYGKLAPNIEFGEPNWHDKGKPLKRLTYNPDYQAMVDDILSWLKGL